jgi:CBS domain-containing protein
MCDDGRGANNDLEVTVLADQILEGKGRNVTTVAPEATVRMAVEALRDANVGALVVSSDGSHVDGIVSERDVVRRLASEGGALLDAPISSIMQSEVFTCSRGDHVDRLMHLMTDHRIRHLPVVEDGALAGLVSIGDVVKTHVDELEREKDQLVDYIRTGR